MEDVFYGFSIFPNDINDSNNLVTLSDFPTNTNGSNDGGADLLAGSGFFYETPVKISGSVFFDQDATNDNTLNGTKLSNLNGEDIYVHLVDQNLNIGVNRTTVGTTGEYEFLNVLNDISYSIYLSTQITAVGDTPSLPVLPNDWYVTGEKTNNGVETGYDDNPNAQLVIQNIMTDSEATDFGLSFENY